MPRARDHKAEYARRIASAERRGLSRSQARGHARHGEAPARRWKAVQSDPRLEAALRELRRTGNRELAAKSVNVAPERLRRFLRENVQIKGRGRSLKITDNRPREMTVATRGKSLRIRLRDFEQASINGKHQAAIGKFLESNEPSFLAPFVGQSVIAANGQTHLLEIDPNTLYRLAAEGEGVFHEIYRLIS